MFNLAVIPHFLLHYKTINAISSPRSSRPEMSCKKGVHGKFEPLFNKAAGLPVIFVKFLRTSFFIEHLWWLLLFSVETVFSFALLFFLNAFF